MVDQASVNGPVTARPHRSSSAELDGVAEFVDDLASLAELQAELAAADLRDATRKSAVPIMLTLGGLGVLLASVPVALLGAGSLLAFALKIDEGWARLLTAGAAMALAGLVAALGRMQLGRSFDSFRRSRKQLQLNMAWVRTVLITSASARTHARRRS